MAPKVGVLMAALALIGFVGCGGQTSITQPTAAVAPQQASPVAAYEATITASASCAANLPAELQVRHYVMTMFQNGRMNWSSKTVDQPPGHNLVSSGQLTGDSLTFSIGIKNPDPQSDSFHGIWETISPTSFLTLQGDGTGTGANGQISGLFAGDFSFFSNTATTGGAEQSAVCSASDHAFTLAAIQPAGDEIRRRF